MKFFAALSFSCILFLGKLSATDLPVLSTYDNEEMNKIDSLKYVADLSAWEKLPQNYTKYQVIQIVLPNAKQAAYETVFFVLGKISREDAILQGKTMIDKMPANLQTVASVRYLTSDDEVKPPDETDELRWYDFLEDKDEVNLVNDNIENIRQETSSKSMGKSVNVFRKDKKYDFRYNGYLLCNQFLPSHFSKELPVALKAKPKPEFHHKDYFNAIVKGGVVCDVSYSIADAGYFSDTSSVELVGGDASNPHCYRLKDGSFVFAQKASQPFGVPTYRVSYVLKTSGETYWYDANTLPSNVKFIPKNNGSVFK